jgi:hypothetical protein
MRPAKIGGCHYSAGAPGCAKPHPPHERRLGQPVTTTSWLFHVPVLIPPFDILLAYSHLHFGGLWSRAKPSSGLPGSGGSQLHLSSLSCSQSRPRSHPTLMPHGAHAVKSLTHSVYHTGCHDNERLRRKSGSTGHVRSCAVQLHRR